MKCESCRQADARMRVNQLSHGRQTSSCLCTSCFNRLMARVERADGMPGQHVREPGKLRREQPALASPARPATLRVPTPLLDRYGRDLRAVGALAAGRQRELQRVMTILGRHQKSNPLLIGEPGVGKTAIVEGLAFAIAQGTVPHYLREKRVLSLNPAHLVAGTTYRGQLEQRISTLLDELRRSPDVIVFIDELHTVVAHEAGGGSGAIGDLLKPALARGELRCIGATTREEYRRLFEKDAALKRRFQPVLIEEPSARETLAILLEICPIYERHHGVRITREALEAAIKLSTRYIPERFLPDKAIDVIDEAGAALQMQAGRACEECPVVTPEHIALTIENWTGIRVGKILESERQQLGNLERDLRARVIGQDEAIHAVACAIRRARAGLKDPRRPVASLLFLGSTGVGKTELAKALAALLFENEQQMIRLDMSEYMEEQSVARLFGSPPGYAGYGDGGQLTEQVRHHPSSLILCDEIEKAHPMVLNAFLQVLDDGRLTDGSGRTVDFKNTVIIMTSNVGAAASRGAHGLGFTTSQALEQQAGERLSPGIQQALKQTFRPEFLNRIDQVVVFRRLGKKDLYRIVDLLLTRVCARLAEQGITLTVTDQVRDFLVRAGYDEEYGVRPLRRALQNHVDDLLADAILNRELCGGQEVTLRLEHGTLRLVVQDALKCA